MPEVSGSTSASRGGKAPNEPLLPKLSQMVQADGSERRGVTAQGCPTAQKLCGLCIPLPSVAVTLTKYVHPSWRFRKQNVSTEDCSNEDVTALHPGNGMSSVLILY